MRVTVDISPTVHHHAGLGRYAGELLNAMLAVEPANDYTAFYYASSIVHPDPPLDRLPACIIRLSAKPWRLAVLLAYLVHLNMDRWLPRGDVFHATDHLLPPLRGTASVLTLYDLTTHLYPQYHSALNRWYSQLMLSHFARRADGVIVISESTRRDAMLILGIRSERMRVIYPGVDSRFRPIDDGEALSAVRAKHHLPSRFNLFLGTVEPRKNIGVLIEAYRVLLGRGESIAPLVVVGRNGWLSQSIFDCVRAHSLENEIRFIGWVPDQEVVALLNCADLFFYPSFYEGFGIPPLEAMACGIPVAVSNVSSLPEVVGDAGISLDPNDAAAWTEAILHLSADEQLRRDLSHRGRARAAQFTWARTARETLEVYRAVCKMRDR